MDRKALSLPILISLVIGNMIGTGIYLLPASLAEYGTISLASWVYTSIGALFLALTFARLNKRFPKTGGPYVYCKEAYGRLAGFIVAYTYWMSNMVSIAGISVASVGYLGFLVPTLNANSTQYSPHFVLFVELATVWLFTIINLVGIHTAGVVQLVLTVIKILPLVAISLFGITHIHLSNLSQFTNGQVSTLTAMTSAAALTFWAFIGLESATVPAENTSGSSDVSKATIFGAIATGIVYISSSFVLMGMMPLEQLRTSQFPFAEAGTMLFGQHAAIIITMCAFLSGLGALNVCTLLQGQIVFAAARDHLFPRIFAKLSKHDVPVAGQLLSAGIVSAFLCITLEPTLLKQFNIIILLAGVLTLLTYFLTTLSEIKFIIQSGKSVLKHILIPVLAAIYSIWMISCFDYDTILITGVIVAFCVPLYLLTVRRYTPTT